MAASKSTAYGVRQQQLVQLALADKVDFKSLSRQIADRMRDLKVLEFRSFVGVSRQRYQGFVESPFEWLTYLHHSISRI